MFHTADTQCTLPIGPLSTATHRNVHQTQLEHILQGLASLTLAHRLYHTESLHLRGHPATAVIIKSETQETYCSTYKQLIFNVNHLVMVFIKNWFFFLFYVSPLIWFQKHHKFVFLHSSLFRWHNKPLVEYRRITPEQLISCCLQPEPHIRWHCSSHLGTLSIYWWRGPFRYIPPTIIIIIIIISIQP
jgi:hypothetical protein